MVKHKLVFISSVATPAQVKFCYALQPYFDAEFWFYEQPDRSRGTWWRTELGDKCRIIQDTSCISSERYMTWGLSGMLGKLMPDIVMVGGFSIPGNYIAYRWARANHKKTIVFTERSRNAKGEARSFGLTWCLLRWLYRSVDMVMVSAEDIVPQFRDEFHFGDKVVAGRYAADLDAYFTHPQREPKTAYNYLYANRMTDIYNPLGCLEIFAEIHRRHQGSRLLMNAAGELGDECKSKIRKLGLENVVEFLTDISSWDQLHKVYARSDILLLPARFSNGNFTILEAMASGMGVVISDEVLGIGKLVKNDYNGFNCELSTKSFVECIERYIDSPSLFAEHSEINRRLVQPLSADGTAKFFAEIVSDKLTA
jgi:glycosyltransferase involved in cell wall biosynthesis